ncbi:aldose epimerase family protein [Croceicoccus hydrothermalis]|uniref:aldose epimerase family protein n=1 Tax=Croceicoccus hydrothermalis TaxID=2867964 RepID=UPI001EFB8B7D|nr:aldose epimerase family protein [Croceicoccus hydrothermalis]
MAANVLAVLALGGANPALAAEAEREIAATLDDGTIVEAVTLSGDNGVSVTLLSLGATLWKFMAPDRDGVMADITIGSDDIQSYKTRPNYWGVTVGRFANRIDGGRFTLDGKTYQLPTNDGENTLHGGGNGFDVQNWTVSKVTQGSKAQAVFTLVSEHGDSGYPGRVEARTTYTLDDDGALTITFDASTDKPTIINMTNHALFNMAGQGAPQGAMDNILTIPAARYTPVTENLIPTGELRPVEGTPFDFRKAKPIRQGLRDGGNQQIVYGRGFDHNFALDKGVTRRPELAARLEDPVSGRVLEVLSTEPGVQFYSGNFLDGTYVGKNDTLYRMGDGIALEPQKFPDAPNQPDFASARVDPGKPYRHVMVYRVSVAR